MRAAAELGNAPAPAATLRHSFVRAALTAGRAVVGRRFSELAHGMDEAQWLPAAALQERSGARLRALLEHTAATVPFYRELGISVSGSPMEALRRFPVMSKSAYRERGLEPFCSDRIPDFRRIDRSTSGSTGEPFRFVLDRAALPVIFASHLFYDSWFGLRPFDRYVRIMSPPAPVPGLPPKTPVLFRIRDAATRRLQRLYESWTQEKIMVWEVSADTAESIYRRMERFKPDYVLGYTSTLAVIADELIKRGLRLSRPIQAVVTIAETLSAPRRKLIEDYFAPEFIVNRYGMREFGSWSAQNCTHSPDRFHINTELVVAEVLREDGSAASPGEIGRVVLTDLWNYARPFVRYFTGDLAVAGPAGPCACGRGFPLLGQIEGRSHECLYTPSGKVISPAVLGHYLFVYNNHLDSVRHYQLVQDGDDSVRLLVMPSNRWTDGTAAVLAEAIDKLVGGEMHVTVEPVLEIPTERSGKRPIIKSQGPRPRGACPS
jgi:phenylacetate-CoA ligase